MKLLDLLTEVANVRNLENIAKQIDQLYSALENAEDQEEADQIQQDIDELEATYEEISNNKNSITTKKQDPKIITRLALELDNLVSKPFTTAKLVKLLNSMGPANHDDVKYAVKMMKNKQGISTGLMDMSFKKGKTNHKRSYSWDDGAIYDDRVNQWI